MSNNKEAERKMREFTFKSEIWLPHPLDVVFSFFADARNLEILTPPWLQFKVLTPEEIKMAPGTIIDYRLRIHGIPLRWKSEITCWKPPHVFIDEQRRGPYTLWIHEHLFQENEGGTLAEDSVRYAVPGGKLIHDLFVKRDIKKIFTYRMEKLKEVFTAK